MKFNKIHVILRGLPPGLLMNRISLEGLNRKSGITVREYDPNKEAEQNAYIAEIDGRRQLYIPSMFVYNMILHTSSRPGIKIGEKPAKQILAHIEIMPEKIPLGTDKYEVYTSYMIVLGHRISRARALVPEWAIKFDIIYVSELISNPYIIRDILEEAGHRVGLLNRRPQQSGPFGTFTVEQFDVENDTVRLKSTEHSL